MSTTEMNVTTRDTEVIAIADIVKDDYQRATNPRQVANIAANFNEAKLGAIVVSKRDGKYYLIDGAHRVSALRQLKHEFAVAFVLEDMTYEEEADYFANQNENRRPLSPIDLFQAKVRAGNEMCVCINEIVESNGFKVHTKDRIFENLGAVYALKTVAVDYGYDVLDKTLRLIRETWDGVQTATGREFLVGVAEFVSRFGTCSFVERIKSVPFPAIWQNYQLRIGSSKTKQTGDPIIRKIFCEILVENYNKGLITNSKMRLRMEENHENRN